MTRRVYPVEGRFLQDRPHVEHDCDDPFCVESGAFTTKKPREFTATNSPQSTSVVVQPTPAKIKSEES